MPATAAFTIVGQVSASPPAGAGNTISYAVPATSITLEADTNTIAQVVVDPDDTLTGDPQTLEMNLCVAHVSTTPDHTTEKFTSAGHGMENGQALVLGGTPPAEFTADTVYYVVNKAVNDFQLSATVGGSAIAFTDNGTSVTYQKRSTAYTPTYAYPTAGPGIPVQFLNGTGELQDFTRVKAIQFTLMARDTESNASGAARLTAGNPSDLYAHFSVPLTLDYTAGDPEIWPSWTAPLPDGFVYNASYDLTLNVQEDIGNENLRIIITLMGK